MFFLLGEIETIIISLNSPTLHHSCFWTVVLEKTLESPMDCKEIQPVHYKGYQSCVFFGKNDAKAETSVVWPPHAKSWLIGKDSDAGRDWGHEEEGTTEDEMAGWHHRLNGHEFEWTPGVDDGQGGLAHCNSWGRKESDMTERLNWTELKSMNAGEFPGCLVVRVLGFSLMWPGFNPWLGNWDSASNMAKKKPPRNLLMPFIEPW